MKFLIGLAVFTLMAVLAWPYLYVWRLDGAVAARDVQALGRLVDIESVRQQVKAEFSRDVNDAVGGDGGQIYRWVKQGIKAVSDTAIDANIDLEWVLSTLETRPGEPPEQRASLMGDMIYAFYESYDTFIVRLGELGDNAMHVRLRLQNNEWRVVEIFTE